MNSAISKSNFPLQIYGPNRGIYTKPWIILGFYKLICHSSVFLLVAGKVVLLAPNQLLSLPRSMLTNLSVPMATTHLVLTPQASTSQTPVPQSLAASTSNQDSQEKMTCANKTVGSSVRLPLASTAVNMGVQNSTSSIGSNKTTETACAAVSSMSLLTSSMSTVPSLPVQTNSTASISMLSSRKSPSNAPQMSSSTVATQFTQPSVSFSRSIAITAPMSSRPFCDLTNSSLNILVPQQHVPSASSIINAAAGSKNQPPICNGSSSLSLNAAHNTASNNLPANPTLPFPMIVNNASLPTSSLNVSAQVSQSSSSSVFSTTDVGANIPWSKMLQTSTNANISPSQTQCSVRATAVQSMDLNFPSASNFDTTSALACSSMSLVDSVTSTAPLDASLDINAMTYDTTAPSLMSPQSLQSMLQSMLSQADAQLLWNTMLSSPMMTSPIFKLANSSNSNATTTCTVTNFHPKTSPVEQRSEQFASQQTHQIAQQSESTEANADMISENIQDAFSDLNVLQVSEQDRLAEEVIFSAMLSSKAKGAGSGYGLGININELLNDVGIVQDAFNP